MTDYPLIYKQPSVLKPELCCVVCECVTTLWVSRKLSSSSSSSSIELLPSSPLRERGNPAGRHGTTVPTAPRVEQMLEVWLSWAFASALRKRHLSASTQTQK